MRILGIEFYLEGSKILDELHEGGLVQVPSGPGLACDLPSIPAYREALMRADFVIPDSGLMVLIWNAMNCFSPQKCLSRYSGLRLLRELFARPEVRAEGTAFWIMPNVEDRDRNLEWLRENGFDFIDKSDCYLAPYYRGSLGADGVVEDAELLAIIEERRPQYVFVNVGSGVQEQLGWYLRKNLSYKPAILCTGAAIAFLSGGQASIPSWADRYLLGWMMRILSDPNRYGTRYRKALRLIPVLLRCRDRCPAAITRNTK